MNTNSNALPLNQAHLRPAASDLTPRGFHHEEASVDSRRGLRGPARWLAAGAALSLLLAGGGSQVLAESLSVTFDDPLLAAGDEISTAGDATQVRLVFDSVTGAYTVTWTASAANPFSGEVLLRLNLGKNGSLLFNFHQDFSGVNATELSYSGTNPALPLHFHPGDTIVTFVESSFGSVVIDGSNLSSRDWVTQSATVTAAVTDTDGDGVPDDADECPNSDLGPTVRIGGCDSGVSNDINGAPVDAGGCSLADDIAGQLTVAATGARNHGQFVSAMAAYLNRLRKTGVITDVEKDALMTCIGSSDEAQFRP